MTTQALSLKELAKLAKTNPEVLDLCHPHFNNLLVQVIKESNVEAIKDLIDLQADLNMPVKEHGSIMHLALKYYADIEVIETLINAGFDLSHAAPNGDSVLHTAIFKGASQDVIELLASKMPDINVQNNDGNTALHEAALYNPTVEIIQALLDSGANPLINNAKGLTALGIVYTPPMESEEYYFNNDFSTNAEKESIVDILSSAICNMEETTDTDVPA